MLRWLSDKFIGFVNIILTLGLIINIIGGAIALGIIVYNSWRDSDYTILAVIGGALLGFILWFIEAVFISPIIIISDIDSRLSNVSRKMLEIGDVNQEIKKLLGNIESLGHSVDNKEKITIAADETE